ncbi:MAG: hypothetical protein ABH950_01575 [Candidatus Altiarchaeota archaeon]
MEDQAEKKTITIDANEAGNRLHHKDLNKKIRAAVKNGAKHITVKNVCGQRFIGAGISSDDLTIEVEGDAGLDLGVFSSGIKIIVHGSSEYLLGNTLNKGELIVYGSSWDITGMGAKGGTIYVMGNGGSRIGIHMKEFHKEKPLIVYGGTVKQFLGEYMAGGNIVVLGLDFSEALPKNKNVIQKKDIDPKKIKHASEPVAQSDLGAGIHGGAIYVRGEVPDELLGVYATKKEFSEEDKKILEPIWKKFQEYFNTPLELIAHDNYTKIVPYSSRPFGKAYTNTPI